MAQSKGKTKAPESTEVQRGRPTVGATGVAAIMGALQGMGASVAKKVTGNTITTKVGVPLLLTILEPMHKSTFKKPEDTDYATICSVGDCMTGEQNTLLVPTVVAKNLNEQYPDNGYVGKVFAIVRTMQRPGKRYFDHDVTEITLPPDFKDRVAAGEFELPRLAAPKSE